MSEHKIYKTPLLQKIGIKVSTKNIVLNAPLFIQQLLSGENILYDINPDPRIKYDCIWVFVNSIQVMEAQLNNYQKKLTPKGMLWVSWHKKSSKQPSELNENIIRDTAWSLDLVDIKVASVDDTWSALKLVIPIAKRK